MKKQKREKNKNSSQKIAFLYERKRRKGRINPRGFLFIKKISRTFIFIKFIRKIRKIRIFIFLDSFIKRRKSAPSVDSIQKKQRSPKFLKGFKNSLNNWSILSDFKNPEVYQTIFSKIKNFSFRSFILETKIFFLHQKISVFQKKLTAILLIVVLTFGSLFFNSFDSLGATYTFNQTDWSGGVTSNTAAHPGNQNNWDKYSSKDAAINAGTEVKLETATGNSNVDFSSEENYDREGLVLYESSNIDFGTESQYIQEDSTNGTDIYNGEVSLAMQEYSQDSYDKLLVHSNSTDGSASFTDSSSSGHTVTALGNVHHETDQTVLGNTAIQFDGTGDYLSVSDSNDWDFGTEDWTIDSWVRFSSSGNHHMIFDNGGYSSGVYVLAWSDLSQIQVYLNNTAYHFAKPGNFSTDTWYHLAVVRNGNNLNVYVDGQSIGTTQNISGKSISSTGFYIGRSYSGTTYYLDGYLDEIRVSKGIARWSADFSLPLSVTTTQPYYVTTSDTSQINTSIYGSITGVTLTQTTPTNTDLKYLVSFDGRSTWKYWNGSSWQASTLANLQTNGMSKTTLEAITESQWAQTNGFQAGTTTNLNFAADLSTSNSSVTPSLDNIQVGYSYYVSSTSNIDFGTESQYIQENSADGTDIYNGKVTLSGGVDSYSKLMIHSDTTDGSTTFTDSSASAHTITASGDVHHEINQKKFGSSSIQFDGTGDYLSVPDSADWNFGTDDFTVDFWVNFASLTGGENNANPNLIHQSIDSNNRNGFAIWAGDLYMYFRDGGVVRGYYDVPWSPSLDTWYHLAFVRSGTKGYIFIDGVNQTVTENIAFGTNSIGDLSAPLDIGSSVVSGITHSLNGYIDELRVSKGVARWTSDFSMPTNPYKPYPTTQAYYVTTSDTSQVDVSAYTHIFDVNLTQTTPANTDLKYLVSFDGRSTWKYWNGSSWQTSTLANFQTNGMSKSTLEAITQSQWSETGGFQAGTTSTLDFAADLSTSDSTVTPSLENIAVGYSYDTNEYGTEINNGAATLRNLEVDSYTKLLIHSDTTDGSTTFTDSSASAHTITANGDAHHEIDQKKFGSSSIQFDGTGDYLSASDSDDWNFGSDNFTIDTWLRFNGSVPTSRDTIVSQFELTGRSWAFEFNGSSPALSFVYSTSGTGGVIRSVSWSPSADTWYHVAVVRNGSDLMFFVDGAQQGSTQSITGTLFDSSEDLKVGKYIDAQLQYFVGYLDELRISKGIARWTSDFSVPTSAYRNYPTTQPYYITTNDTSQVNTSAYRSITGVTLTQTTPTNTDLKYLVSFDDRSTWKYWNGSSWQTSTLANFQTNGMSKTTLEAITESQWAESGGFQAGTTTTLDFAADLSTSDSSVTPSLDNIQVGYSYYVSGANSSSSNIDFAVESDYIQEDSADGTDISNGIADLHGYGVDSYTKLMIHSDTTDGSTTFTDSSSNAHTITANGDAHHEIDQKKFGNTSIDFDGSGDYLLVSDSTDWNFGSDDFTIDFWMRANAFSGYGAPVGYYYSNNYAAFKFHLHGSALSFYASTTGSSWAISGESIGTLSTNTWYHIAVVREGNTLKGYLNGTQAFSRDASSITMSQGNDSFSIGGRKTSTSTDQFINGYIDELRVSKGIARWSSDFSVPTEAYYAHNSSQPYYITTSDTSQIDVTTYRSITGVTLTQTTPTNTDLKYLVSFDGRSTWKYWDGDSWEASSLANLQTNGMSKTTLEAITESQWGETNGFESRTTRTLDFAVDLSTSDSSVTPSLDNIQVDYTYYVSQGYSNVDFNTEGEYVQEDSTNGTDFTGASVTLAGGANDSYTKLMIHSNTADGSTTFTDSSSSVHTVTAVGNVHHEIDQKKFGNTSIDFDGTDDYLSISDSDDWYLGTGDFTVDFWAYFNSWDSVGLQTLFGQDEYSSPRGWQLFYSDSYGGSNFFRFWENDGGSFDFSDYALNLNTWYHVALVRSGTSWMIFVNGTQYGSTVTSSMEVLDRNIPFYIGDHVGYSGRDIDGYIDEFRLSKGIARWTSNFSVPTSAYTSYLTTQPYYVTTSDTSQVNVSSYASITGLKLTQTTPTNTDLKYLVSFDGRSTWKYWNGSSWQTSTLANLGANGMSKSTLEGITESQWSESGGFQAGTTTTLNFAVDLSTSNSSVTPSLDNIQVGYSYNSPGYPALTSSWYNVGDTYNVMGKISWSETLPSGTDAKFQIQTAPDSSGSPGTATGWMGPSGTDTTYFTDSSGGDSIPAAFTSGNNDQWFQYKLFLETSDVVVTPVVSDLEMKYVINAPPELQSVTASQDSDGHVNISYQVRDSDTTSGTFTPGYVTPSFEYWNGSAWESITTLASGDTSNKAVNESTYTTHTATWTPKTDFANQFMNGTAQIRVTVNDNEGSNNTASATSSNFTLDTADPTNVSFTIDHTSNKLTLTTPSDDSSYQMYVSNVSDFSGATAENFSSPYTYSSMTNDPATVYVRIKDVYGNYTDVSVVTPAKPENLVRYDLSDTSTSDYRLFIAWDAIPALQVGSGFSSYDVYRSTDGSSYTLVSSVNNRTINYYLDTGLSSSTTYYYKVLSKDTNGNQSEYSSVVNDIPDGQGSSDSTAPTISNVTVSNIQTTSATVTWTTDEVATSNVGYSTDTSYSDQKGVASLSASHEIVLTGLSANTTYNIQTESRDVSNNVAQNNASNPGTNNISDFSFTTLPGPAISNVTVPNISNNQATISWETTTDSSTYVVYGTSVTGGSIESPTEVGSPSLVGGSAPYSHSQEITSLAEGTTYYFYVKSIDSSSNTAIDNNGGEFYQLLTTKDDDPPVVSSVGTSIISDTEVAIHWVTDEQATSQVKYSTTQGGSYTETTQSSVLSQSHYVIINGLTSDTTYYYQVVSEDINTNSTTSSEYSFTTEKDPEYQHDPLASISDVSESVVTDQKAVISFKTDQPAQCYIEYGTSSGSYTEIPVVESDYNKNHAIHLSGLIFSTTYYYSISCADNLSNTVSHGSEGDFTTLEDQGTESDSTAPSISSVSEEDIAGETATITWKTNEDTNSLVKYGITEDYEHVAGNSAVMDVADYVSEHSVIITNLTPSTKYYYAVVSYDEAGNKAESSQQDFTTSSPSTISSIKVESQSLGQAVITWTTSKDTSSVVEYGLTEEYGDSVESSSRTTDHSATLSSLESNETYHFRVKGTDEDNNIYSSADYTFEPKSPPNISGIDIVDVTEDSAKVTFATSAPTDALVSYTSESGEGSGSQGKPGYVTDHELELANLNSGTNFSISIQVRDEDGNEATEEGGSFTTGLDEKPPIIDQIKTDSALAKDEKVQTIISWVTDEPANTVVIYKEGLNGEEREVVINSALAENHVAVMTTFKPGTVYYFKTKAVDAYGNEVVSQDYALLTPRRRENIVQVIISNFQDIFSWANIVRY